ncbi:MAG: hypothetical protein PVI30_28110, partial [Myxococcales bacterium]
AAALVVLRLTRGPGSLTGLVLSTVMLGAAALTALVAGGLWSAAGEEPSARVAAAAMALGLLAVTHYGAAQVWGHRERATRWLAPISLVCAVVVLYGGLRLVILALLPAGEPVELAQTLLVAGSSLGVLLAGHRRALHGAVPVGLAGLVLLGGKVVVVDLAALEGALVAVSVLTLGLAALAASFILRGGHRAPAGRASEDPDGDTR